MTTRAVDRVVDAARRARTIFREEISFRVWWQDRHPTTTIFALCGDDRLGPARFLTKGQPQDYPDMGQEKAQSCVIPHWAFRFVRNVGSRFEWDSGMSQYVYRHIGGPARRNHPFMIIPAYHWDERDNQRYGCAGNDHDRVKSRAVVETFAEELRGIFDHNKRRQHAIITAGIETSTGGIIMHGKEGDLSTIAMLDEWRTFRKPSLATAFVREQVARLEPMSGDTVANDLAMILSSNMARLERNRAANPVGARSVPHTGPGVGFGKEYQWMWTGGGPPILIVNNLVSGSKASLVKAIGVMLSARDDGHIPTDEELFCLVNVPYTGKTLDAEWKAGAIVAARKHSALCRKLIAEHYPQRARDITLIATVVHEKTQRVSMVEPHVVI